VAVASRPKPKRVALQAEWFIENLGEKIVKKRIKSGEWTPSQKPLLLIFPGIFKVNKQMRSIRQFGSQVELW
jgi:hypothetical protein